MAGYAFSQRVRRVLKTGADAARVRRHEYIGTEHLLLGLIAEREGVASAVLDSLAVDRAVLTAQIDGAIGSFTTNHDYPGHNCAFRKSCPGQSHLQPFESHHQELQH